MNMDKLKSCPFCGGDAKLVSHHSCDCCNKAYNGMVMCRDCGAEVSHRDTDDEAITAWNKRAHDHPDTWPTTEQPR